MPATPPRVAHVALEVGPWCGTGPLASAVAGLAAAQHRAGERVTVIAPRASEASWPQWALQAVEGARGILDGGGGRRQFSLHRLRHPAGFEVILIQDDTRDPSMPPAESDAAWVAAGAGYALLHAGGRWDRLIVHDAVGAHLVVARRDLLASTPLQHVRAVVVASALQPSAVGAPPLWPQRLRTSDLVIAPAEASIPILERRCFGPDAPHRPNVVAVPDALDVSHDPTTDMDLAASFGPEDQEGRVSTRQDLLAQVPLEGPEEAPIVAILAPFDDHAGFNACAEALPSLIAEGVRFMLVGGSGPDSRAVEQVVWRHAGHVAHRVAMEAREQRVVLAGCDAVLLATREGHHSHNLRLCRRYGAVPILRRTPLHRALVPDEQALWFDDDRGIADAVRSLGPLLADRQRLHELRAAGFRDRRSWDDVAAQLHAACTALQQRH